MVFDNDINGRYLSASHPEFKFDFTEAYKSARRGLEVH
jgi:hypothetical protein